MRYSSLWLLLVPVLLVACAEEDPRPAPTATTPEPVVEVQRNESEETPEEAPKTEPEVSADSADSLVEPDVIEPPVTEAETPAADGLSGEFSYVVDYLTPGGKTPLTVTFSLDDNTVNQVKLIGDPKHKISDKHQKTLHTELNQLVLGKKLVDVAALPSRLAGSSLTAPAFNQALSQLKAEA